MLERLMALLGLVDPGGDYDDEEEDDLRPDLEEREGRVLRPAAGEADLILLRGSSGPDRKEELLAEIEAHEARARGLLGQHRRA